jgi:hypothetical protein
MAKITIGQAVDLQTFSQAEAKIGDYKWSHLEEADFEAEHLGDWMLCDGQSAVGTAFATITGEASVPNALADGTFIRQAKAGRTKGTNETDSTSVNGLQSSDTYLSQIEPRYPRAGTYLTNFSVPRTGYSTTWQTGNGSGPQLSSRMINSQVNVALSNGDSETAPKNIALNLYVKVGY